MEMNPVKTCYTNDISLTLIFTARCMSVCLSIHNVDVLWTYRLVHVSGTRFFWY